MKKQDLVNLYQSLNNLGNLKGVKFNYCVSKNIKMIEPEIQSLDESMKPSEEYKKFDLERIELAKKHSKKDEKGEAISEIKNNLQQFVLENKEEFEKEINILKEKYKEVVEQREKQIEEYKKLLEEEISMIFHKVKVEDVPQDITGEQMNRIFEIIAE